VLTWSRAGAGARELTVTALHVPTSITPCPLDTLNGYQIAEEVQMNFPSENTGCKSPSAWASHMEALWKPQPPGFDPPGPAQAA